jgi:hypothetical protein
MFGSHAVEKTRGKRKRIRVSEASDLHQTTIVSPDLASQFQVTGTFELTVTTPPVGQYISSQFSEANLTP